MEFHELLNAYIKELNCTARELSQESGLSPATLSRYRNGERIPEINSDAFHQICTGIASISARNSQSEQQLTQEQIAESFLKCPDIIATDKEQFRQKLNTLIAALNVNITKLCLHTNYEVSALFRIRNGSRSPSKPDKLAADIAGYITREMNSVSNREILSKLIGCTSDELSDSAKLCEHIRDWLIAGQERPKDSVAKFLESLDAFDLNEYIKSIHFDELKVPTAPFQLPTSKTYFGLADMMTSEIDFLKATVLSKSMEDVIMYSDMPMEEMAKDEEFPKKWMFGMAMMLKKGLHLNMIHNIDRPFHEMMLGLESWIPMYITGQVSPFYLKDAQNDVFLHFLKVSGSAALSGEAIAGCHSDGKYYLTKNKDEVAYYKKRAKELLSHANSLMDIYRVKNAETLYGFLLNDAHTPGKRRSILSTPSLYTMDRNSLSQLLQNHHVSESESKKIMEHADAQRQTIEKMLETVIIEDEIPILSKEEFERYPAVLPLSELFLETDIPYTYEEYTAHIQQTKEFKKSHPNYFLRETSVCAFRNLQIHIHEGKWAMVSKSKSPAIHFVIHHPKLCSAIEKFVPPVVEPES